MNTVYVVFMGWVHHAFFLTEAEAREYVRKYIGNYDDPAWEEVSKNRWEWCNFIITIEERELHG